MGDTSVADNEDTKPETAAKVQAGEQVDSVGCDRGVQYFTMQFIEGRSLPEVMASRRLTATQRSSLAQPTFPCGLANSGGERATTNMLNHVVRGSETCDCVDRCGRR